MIHSVEKIIVFAGSTLSQNEINSILPNCFVHFPVKCGDILRLLRLNPTKIIIIDGLFEQSAAVWHKEILIGIDMSVSVYGSSSMGALRASELYLSGMIGWGNVFEYYKQNKIVDDDEVAVTHVIKDNKLINQSMPLINIRFTLSKAISDNIIDIDTQNDFINNIKKIPYYERNWNNMRKVAENNNLFDWVVENYIDQKKLDAIELLKNIKANINSNINPNKNTSHSTFFIRKLYREIMSSPFDYTYDWLPTSEKTVCYALTKEKDTHLKVLSKLLHIASEILCLDNNMDIDTLNSDIIIDRVKQHIETNEIGPILNFYLIHSGLLIEFKQNSKKWMDVKNTVYNISLLLAFLKRYCEIHILDVSVEYQNKYFDILRRKFNLLRASDIKAWLNNNGISDKISLSTFKHIGALFHYVIILNNAEFLGIRTVMNFKTWLIEAYTLSQKQIKEKCFY